MGRSWRVFYRTWPGRWSILPSMTSSAGTHVHDVHHLPCPCSLLHAPCQPPACSMSLQPPACSMSLQSPACSMSLQPPACSMHTAATSATTGRSHSRLSQNPTHQVRHGQPSLHCSYPCCQGNQAVLLPPRLMALSLTAPPVRSYLWWPAMLHSLTLTPEPHHTSLLTRPEADHEMCRDEAEVGLTLR